MTGSEEFIPMRDLFTSPAVSYAYERGWRQGFAQAGFPGPDVEADMAMDYFAPVVARTNYSVVVDMSCATGKFERIVASGTKELLSATALITSIVVFQVCLQDDSLQPISTTVSWVVTIPNLC